MYAIVKTGGRQYRVEQGAVIDVERLPIEENQSIELDEVLLLVPDSGTPSIGKPLVSGAKVTATCVKQFRGDKIRVFRYRAKQRFRRTRGHRQYYTRLRIESIVGG